MPWALLQLQLLGPDRNLSMEMEHLRCRSKPFTRCFHSRIDQPTFIQHFLSDLHPPGPDRWYICSLHHLSSAGQETGNLRRSLWAHPRLSRPQQPAQQVLKGFLHD